MSALTHACAVCGEAVSWSEFLMRSTDAGFRGLSCRRFRCNCGDLVEYLIREDGITLGYVSAAGEPHFCGTIDIVIPGFQGGPKSHIGSDGGGEQGG